MIEDTIPFLVVDKDQPFEFGESQLSRVIAAEPHNAVLEQIVDVICNRTTNNDRNFFRMVTLYHLAKMASSMRATLVTKDRGNIPVNFYVVALATSGFGKGHSVGLLEKAFLKSFRQRFMTNTFPVISDKTLYDLATDRAVVSGKDPNEELEKANREFAALGGMLFSFDSATTAAIKQLRQKLLMSGCGSLNLKIDEIGSNLAGSQEALIPFLELYDQGEADNSLRKNGPDNIRGEDIDGKTPANAMLFGTPTTLFDGFANEGKFMELLEAGMGRRCAFAWGTRPDISQRAQISPRDKYLQRTKPKNSATLAAMSQHFSLLADPSHFGWEIQLSDDVAIELTAYENICMARAEALGNYDPIRKAEMEHRHFKALKVAGVLAFVDESSEVTMDHLYQAFRLMEESGDAFEQMLKREKPHVRLARYIAEKGGDLTHAELHEQLPFYKASKESRNELMSLAVSWGYKNHIIIRKTFRDEGVEIFTGETLQKTSLEKIGLSWSGHEAFNYEAALVPFEAMEELVTAPAGHWCNHAFTNNHRREENVQPGFNLIVVDVDGGIPLEVTHKLMKDYAFMTYTTKRHTDEEHRYRLLLPTNYILRFDKDDYRTFIDGVLASLPFPMPTDPRANQRSKKWLTHGATQVHFNLGADTELFDVLPHLPRTSRNEVHQKSMEPLQSLDNLERWFAQKIGSGQGQRNVQLHNYARLLVDEGMNYSQVEEALLNFNRKLPNGLEEDELRQTILITVARSIHGNP